MVEHHCPWHQHWQYGQEHIKKTRRNLLLLGA